MIVPVSYALLRRASRPVAGSGFGEGPIVPSAERREETGRPACAWMPDEALSLRQAIKTPMFWALTAGFFT